MSACREGALAAVARCRFVRTLAFCHRRQRRNPGGPMSWKLLTTTSLLCLAMLLAPRPASAGTGAESCGGGGQRACCNGCGEYSNAGTACNSGTFIVGGSHKECGYVHDPVFGGDLCAPLGIQIYTNDACRAYTSCGAAGQRACCATEDNRSQSCNFGLVE